MGKIFSEIRNGGICMNNNFNNNFNGGQQNYVPQAASVNKKLIIAVAVLSAVLVLVAGFALGMIFGNFNEEEAAPEKISESSQQTPESIQEGVSAPDTDKVNEPSVSQPESSAQISDSVIKLGNYIGSDYKFAQTQIETLGLTVKKIEYEYSETVPQDAVIKQSPAANTELKKNDKVTLTVSKGKDTTVKLENLEGLSLSEAQAWLTENGLGVKINRKNYLEEPADKVTEQSPAAGKKLKKDDTVTLTVSDGMDFTGVPLGCSQLVYVAGSGGTSAVMRLYNYQGGKWVYQNFTVDAVVGEAGISSVYGEAYRSTPKGCFKLGEILTTANTTPRTIIVEDTTSPYYNCIVDSGNMDGDPIGSRLSSGRNNALIFIQHNGDGHGNGTIKGDGSSITICGCNEGLKPTWGCIDITASNMNTLIDLLDYSRNPYILTE